MKAEINEDNESESRRKEARDAITTIYGSPVPSEVVPRPLVHKCCKLSKIMLLLDKHLVSWLSLDPDEALQ